MMGVAAQQARAWSPVPKGIEPALQDAIRAYLDEHNRPSIVTVWNLMFEIRARVAACATWSDKRLKLALTWAIREEGYQLRGSTAYERQDPAHPVRREEA